MKYTAIFWGDEEQHKAVQYGSVTCLYIKSLLTSFIKIHYMFDSLGFIFFYLCTKEMQAFYFVIGKQCDLLFSEAQPRPRPSNAVSARPSVAVVSSATLLMLVSACV